MLTVIIIRITFQIIRITFQIIRIMFQIISQKELRQQLISQWDHPVQGVVAAAVPEVEVEEEDDN